MMSIRTAAISDAAELLDIYAYYVENTAITFEYDVPSTDEFRRRIEHTLERYPYLAAVENGRITGYAYAGTFKPRAAYAWCVETSLYVAKDARGRGIGSALLHELEGILRRQNILNVNACITVPREREDEYLTSASERFHEKKGYTKVGTFHDCGYKFGRWYNMIWMEKMLGDHGSFVPAVIPFPDLGNTGVWRN